MKKMYIIVLLLVISVFLFVSCKKGEYKTEDGKLYHFHYPGVGVSTKREVKEADLKTFKQINELYGIDKNHAYHMDASLPDSDPKSFEIIDDIYSKDKNSVYWYSNYIPNAIPSTFQIINEDYTKDNNSVFYKKENLPNADPKTFKIIDGSYSKDNNNVYYYTTIISKAKPETFEKITYSMWKDKHNVFYYDSILPNADPKTMKKVKGYNSWFTDKNAVYKMDNRIDVAPEDFEVLYYCWGRSKTDYYFNHIPMPLDYATTEILTEEGEPTKLTPYIKDKNNVFYKDKKIEGADPKTFVATWSFRAYDANHKYRAAEIIE